MRHEWRHKSNIEGHRDIGGHCEWKREACQCWEPKICDMEKLHKWTRGQQELTRSSKQPNLSSVCSPNLARTQYAKTPNLFAPAAHPARTHIIIITIQAPCRPPPFCSLLSHQSSVPSVLYVICWHHCCHRHHALLQGKRCWWTNIIVTFLFVFTMMEKKSNGESAQLKNMRRSKTENKREMTRKYPHMLIFGSCAAWHDRGGSWADSC